MMAAGASGVTRRMRMEFIGEPVSRGFPPPRVIVLELDDETALGRTQARGRADDKAGMTPGRLADYRKVESLLKQHYKAQWIAIDAKPDARAVEAAIRQALGY